MIIYGAGMSGLLAANMLKKHSPVVCEAAATLPNNHGALLRFRTNAVEIATGIKLKKVYVQKSCLAHPDGILTSSPDIQLQNSYSMKVTGEIKGRSIMNLEAGERYIAPDDFIEQLAKGTIIRCGLTLEDLKDVYSKEPIISTIPMDKLMKIAGWSDVPSFGYRSITSINAKIYGMPCEVYQTIYVPFISDRCYRMSITGDTLIIELLDSELPMDESEATEIALHKLKYFFGAVGASRMYVDNVSIKRQKYGKLLPINNHQRKTFILAMTDLHNLYSLGRFATWRQILMDDVVRDVRQVDEMISERSDYARKLKYSV